MSVQLIRGANAPLQTSRGEDVRGVLLGISWDNPSAEVNLFAVLSGANRLVRGEGDFLFWDQPSSPDAIAFLLEGEGVVSAGGDRGQLVLDLAGAGVDVERISLAVGTVDQDNTLGVLGSLSARAVDAHTGEVLAKYVNPDGYGEEACAVIWEVYRRNGAWKLKAVDQGWAGGVPALAKAFGVDTA